MLESQGVTSMLADRFGFEIPAKRKVLDDWKELLITLTLWMMRRKSHRSSRKYTDLADSYLSVIKALQHASFKVNRKLVIDWIESSALMGKPRSQIPSLTIPHGNCSDLLMESWSLVDSASGGLRENQGGGICEENKIPYLGVCLGLQVATIEFCRNVLGMEGANSTEFDEEPAHAAVVFMPEISKTHMGGL